MVSVLFVFLFAGEYIIPEEPAYRYSEFREVLGLAKNTVDPGSFETLAREPFYKQVYDYNSRHLTFIFTTFVLMQ